jgi:ABC-2 type transport system ATP-binding protein
MTESLQTITYKDQICMTAMIEVTDITKVYSGKKEVPALNSVNIQVERGQLFGLLGPNGAGKTTLIGICTTSTIPTSGKIFIAGVDMVKEPARGRRHIGVVPQYRTLDRSCNVFENLYYHCRYYGYSHSAARQRAGDVVEQFRLHDRVDNFPRELSGGIAQRLEIARAIAHQPQVLFLDEPTANLDPQTRLALWDAIRELHAKQGTTIVLTTHNLEEAEALCEKLVILDRGTVLAYGSPIDLRKALRLTIIDVRLKESSGALIERISKIPEVRSVTETIDGLTITAADEENMLQQVIDALAGCRVVNLSIGHPSLEEAFIELTGRELRE